MSANFEYFYGRESEQFNFIRIPKLLFTDKTFSGLSNDAKLLYSLMLDRMSLSKQNGWLDDNGRVYIIFTVEEASEVLNCGTEKVTRLFNELDDSKGIGLITRKRRGLGKPSVIYLHKFMCEGKISENQESGKPKISDTDNTVSSDRISAIQDFGKSKCNNTEYNKTDMNQTDYNHLHTPANENREDDEELISSVNEKIGYETLCSEYDGNIVTELRNIIADVIKGIRPVKVSGTLIDGKRASELFAGLRHRNVVTVLDSMKRTEVHAPSNWIPAALYNSLFTGTAVKQESAPSFDLDLIMEHAKNTPLRLRCCT